MVLNFPPIKRVIHRGRLNAELASLFGSAVRDQAEQVGIDGIVVDGYLVAEGARQLMSAEGDPKKQREIAKAMDKETALALCIWIMEPDCMGQILADIGINR